MTIGSCQTESTSSAYICTITNTETTRANRNPNILTENERNRANKKGMSLSVSACGGQPPRTGDKDEGDDITEVGRKR